MERDGGDKSRRVMYQSVENDTGDRCDNFSTGSDGATAPHYSRKLFAAVLNKRIDGVCSCADSFLVVGCDGG